MAALRVTILANFVGQAWVAVVGLLFLPSYVRLLGIEAFGLVGLMLSFQSILQLFDFGIGAATNRELARKSHNHSTADDLRDLVRTAETFMWLLAAVAIVLTWSASALMAEYWLHLRELSAAQTADAVVIIGIAVAALWPSTFYSQCLAGLERQLASNVISILFTTLRFAGALPILTSVDNSIQSFLWWHAAMGFAQSLASASVVWKHVPKGSRQQQLSLAQLNSSRRFAGGIFLTTLLGVGLTQIDRLALASLRPLEELGYYTLALSVASGMGRLVQPMFSALYPRFTRLVERDDRQKLRELYHLSSQLIATVILAVAAVLIVFSQDILLLWTGDKELAARVATPMSILIAGSAINGLMNVPYALQLAHGWTRLAVHLNLVSLAIAVPFCIFTVDRLGMTGAALPWLVINAGLFFVGLPLMHRRLLKGELSRWYTKDIAPAFLASISAALLMLNLLPPVTRDLGGVLSLALALVTVMAVSTLASRSLWRYALSNLNAFRSR